MVDDFSYLNNVLCFQVAITSITTLLELFLSFLKDSGWGVSSVLTKTLFNKLSKSKYTISNQKLTSQNEAGGDK